MKTRIKGWLRHHVSGYNKHLLQKDIRYLGTGFQVAPYVKIEYPEYAIIGKNVSIGRGTLLSNLGGIVVADGCTIGENVTIGGTQTTLDDKPIVLGRQCIIEDGATIKPGTILDDGTTLGADGTIRRKPEKNFEPYKGEGLFFILSTGASGSKSIAKMLDTHPQIDCKHEPNTLLISLSSAYAYGQIDKVFLTKTLEAIYCKSTTFQQKIVGESDQKFGNLIPILQELLSESKYIWLIRNASDFVRSAAYNKGWYVDQQSLAGLDTIGKKWKYHRLEGDKCNAIPQPIWSVMEPLEKNAWYWSYWNDTIEKSLENVPSSKWLKIPLHALAEEVENIQQFIGVEPVAMPERIDNKSGKNQDRKNLTPEDKKIIDQYCLAQMKKWFPKFTPEC